MPKSVSGWVVAQRRLARMSGEAVAQILVGGAFILLGVAALVLQRGTVELVRKGLQRASGVYEVFGLDWIRRNEAALVTFFRWWAPCAFIMFGLLLVAWPAIT